MEEYSNVYLVSSAEQCPPFTDVVQNLPSGSLISSPSTETGPSSGSALQRVDISLPRMVEEMLRLVIVENVRLIVRS